eukprot:m.73170 g.73170  ORF g.73170 m.73170 type:complete len:522 (-) comp7708_c1_seq1:216-1781(-)
MDQLHQRMEVERAVRSIKSDGTFDKLKISALELLNSDGCVTETRTRAEGLMSEYLQSLKRRPSRKELIEDMKAHLQRSGLLNTVSSRLSGLLSQNSAIKLRLRSAVLEKARVLESDAGRLKKGLGATEGQSGVATKPSASADQAADTPPPNASALALLFPARVGQIGALYTGPTKADSSQSKTTQFTTQQPATSAGTTVGTPLRKSGEPGAAASTPGSGMTVSMSQQKPAAIKMIASAETERAPVPVPTPALAAAPAQSASIQHPAPSTPVTGSTLHPTPSALAPTGSATRTPAPPSASRSALPSMSGMSSPTSLLAAAALIADSEVSSVHTSELSDSDASVEASAKASRSHRQKRLSKKSGEPGRSRKQPRAIMSRAKASKSAPADEAPAEAEEYPCGVCGRVDDNDGGIVCDKCSTGFHLACVKLKSLPKEDWLCESCRAAPRSKTTSRSAAGGVALGSEGKRARLPEGRRVSESEPASKRVRSDAQTDRKQRAAKGMHADRPARARARSGSNSDDHDG